MDNYSQVDCASRLQSFRKGLRPRLSQAEVAQVLEITQTAYSRIEKGVNRISCRLLHYMMTSHHLNVHWLLTGEGEPHLVPHNPSITSNDEGTARAIQNEIEIFTKKILDLKAKV